MKKIIIFTAFLLFLLVFTKVLDAAETDLLYLGEEPPGSEPKIFAPGSVSVEGKTDYVISFSPDGREIYFSRAQNGLMYCMFGDDGWSEPAPVNFGAEYPGGEVHIMKGGEYLLMNRYRGLKGGERGGIWRLRRIFSDGEGARESILVPIWGRPEFLIPNGMRATSTEDGVIYVTDITGHLSQEEGADKGIIARFVLSGEEWKRSEDPAGGINSEESEAHPFISPDESYLIFNSTRPGGAGEGDLYISYRDKDGSWGDAINLETLNTSEADWGATVSPDGKYIFFTRNITGNGDIYWVSSKIIEELRPGG